MTPLELAKFRKALTESWPNTPFHEAEAEVWFDAVADRDAAAVFAALRTLISTCDFRPRLVALLELIYDGKPPAEIAEECRRAIGRFGYHRESEALASLSPAGEKAIEAFGGWVEWCCASDDYGTVEKMARICGTIVRRESRAIGSLDTSFKPFELTE